MIIHVVKEGDTLYKIGQMYGVDYQKIAADNELDLNKSLVVGQTIVIINNINIPKNREIEVNGFAFPNIDKAILTKALSSLTYLGIFSYAADDVGNLKMINDDSLISLAKQYRVVPVMVITNIGTNNKFSSTLAHTILNNQNVQNRLINNILIIMRQKGYKGLDIDFEYVYPQDKDAYIRFINKVNNEFKKHNYFLWVAVAPKTSDEQKGLLYEAHDYANIGMLVDRVIIMTYEWGYSGGPSMAVAPLDSITKVIDYSVTRIPSNKILLGIPNYGYDWTLPFLKGTLAKSISNIGAIDIARNNHQAINYNNEDQSPYFNYYDADKKKHEVWFEDARSIQAKLRLVTRYNLAGISYWTLNRKFPQNYLVLDSTFNIKKLS